MQGKDALLLDGLDGHEAHIRSAHGLADRLRVGRIGLVALDVGLHVLRWDKADEVPEPAQLSRPVVSTRARLHPDYTWRLLREERQQIGATQTTPEHGMAGGIDTVHLENGLGEIKANCNDGHGSGSPWSAPAVQVGLWLQWLASAAYRKPPDPACTNPRLPPQFQSITVYGRALATNFGWVWAKRWLHARA